jgi:hypothetical protein
MGCLESFKRYSLSTDTPTTPTANQPGSTVVGAASSTSGASVTVDGVTIEFDGLGRLRLIIPLDYTGSAGGALIRMVNTGAGPGLRGDAAGAPGVQGISNTGSGLSGESSSGAGVFGLGAIGVSGQSSSVGGLFEQWAEGVQRRVRLANSNTELIKAEDLTIALVAMLLTSQKLQLGVPLQPAEQVITGSTTIAATTQLVRIVAAFTGTVTLPPAGSYPRGAEMVFKDETFVLGTTGSSIAIAPAPGDGIEGAPVALSKYSAKLLIYTDGIATWYQI